jgi:hypothetical protein
VLVRADRALYQAKRAGRNCVRFLRAPGAKRDKPRRRSAPAS